MLLSLGFRPPSYDFCLQKMLDKEIYDLSSEVGELLSQKKLVLVTAESCTGGWIAQAITMVPGSSQWFHNGFITYSNEAKSNLLQVNPLTIREFGAVSSEVVQEMLLGANGLAQHQRTCAIAVSGVAGPDGGSREKPVGTVFIGVSSGSIRVNIERFSFNGDRNEVRRQSVVAGLKMLVDFLGNALTKE
jgi:nicotinamide-nucleotide amidase